MYRTCTICGGIHHEDNMCKRYYKKNTKASKFRNSNAWIIKREQIKQRDKYLCQVCLKDSIYNSDDLQVHHIIPIDKDYDLKLDEDNLITLFSDKFEEYLEGNWERDEVDWSSQYYDTVY